MAENNLFEEAQLVESGQSVSPQVLLALKNRERARKEAGQGELVEIKPDFFSVVYESVVNSEKEY